MLLKIHFEKHFWAIYPHLAWFITKLDSCWSVTVIYPCIKNCLLLEELSVEMGTNPSLEVHAGSYAQHHRCHTFPSPASLVSGVCLSSSFSAVQPVPQPPWLSRQSAKEVGQGILCSCRRLWTAKEEEERSACMLAGGWGTQLERQLWCRLYELARTSELRSLCPSLALRFALAQYVRGVHFVICKYYA